MSYQGVELHYYDVVVKACRGQAVSDLVSLDSEVRDRLEWSDISMLRSFLIYLDTQCWQGKDAADAIFTEMHTALQHITEQFRAPLDAKGVDLTSITEEVDGMIKYARRYLRVDKDSYRRVWFQIATVPDSSEWKNAIQIATLVRDPSGHFKFQFSIFKFQFLFFSFHFSIFCQRFSIILLKKLIRQANFYFSFLIFIFHFSLFYFQVSIFDYIWLSWMSKELNAERTKNERSKNEN